MFKMVSTSTTVSYVSKNINVIAVTSISSGNAKKNHPKSAHERSRYHPTNGHKIACLAFNCHSLYKNLGQEGGTKTWQPCVILTSLNIVSKSGKSLEKRIIRKTITELNDRWSRGDGSRVWHHDIIDEVRGTRPCETYIRRINDGRSIR